VALHGLLFLFAGGFHIPSFPTSTVEIDLTSPLPGDGRAPKLGAPKRLVPNAPIVEPKPAEEPIPEKIPAVIQPPKDWVLPGPDTKKVIAAPVNPITPGGAAGGTGTSPIPGGSGVGADYGVPNGRGTGGSPGDVVPPKLLNGDELRRNMRRFYPENERTAGHEGAVLVAVHIGADGAVSAIDILTSAGAAFDEAAQKIANLMRFEPAKRQGQAVAVKIKAPIIFRLKD
jgi:TonB family protein